jgi:hypothetical protein
MFKGPPITFMRSISSFIGLIFNSLSDAQRAITEGPINAPTLFRIVVSEIPNDSVCLSLDVLQSVVFQSWRSIWVK